MGTEWRAHSEKQEPHAVMWGTRTPHSDVGKYFNIFCVPVVLLLTPAWLRLPPGLLSYCPLFSVVFLPRSLLLRFSLRKGLATLAAPLNFVCARALCLGLVFQSSPLSSSRLPLVLLLSSGQPCVFLLLLKRWTTLSSSYPPLPSSFCPLLSSCPPAVALLFGAYAGAIPPFCFSPVVPQTVCWWGFSLRKKGWPHWLAVS